MIRSSYDLIFGRLWLAQMLVPRPIVHVLQLFLFIDWIVWRRIPDFNIFLCMPFSSLIHSFKIIQLKAFSLSIPSSGYYLVSFHALGWPFVLRFDRFSICAIQALDFAHEVLTAFCFNYFLFKWERSLSLGQTISKFDSVKLNKRAADSAACWVVDRIMILVGCVLVCFVFLDAHDFSYLVPEICASVEHSEELSFLLRH